MREGQSGQELQRAASMGPQTPQSALGAAAGQARAEKEGELQGFLSRLQRSNARINELILMQRDVSLRVCGINPIEEPTPTDAPEPTGVMAEINMGLMHLDELTQKLNQMTDRWLQL